MTTNRTIVSQPVKVMGLELLPAQQRVEQVDAHDHRDDEPEEIGAAEVPDEGQDRERHIRSMPMTSTYRIANMTIPRITATTSMKRSWPGRRQVPIQKPGADI